MSDRKQHWEKIYQTKEDNDVSWYQDKPEASLRFFHKYAVPKEAKIIDVGGGNSRLTEYLLKAGYKDLTVLDISATALDKAKQNLGSLANKVNWIIADITTFQPKEKYKVWHDRAVFHFLTNPQEIKNYIKLAKQSVLPEGLLMMATFSDKGPEKCSGLIVSQYSSDMLVAEFAPVFQKEKCFNIDHQTPFNTMQNFTYCCFRKVSSSHAEYHPPGMDSLSF